MSRIEVHSDIPQGAAGRRRCFGIDEANRSLVLVRRIVADVVASYSRLVDLQEIMETAQVGGDYGVSQRAQQDLMAVAKRLQGFAQELDEVGVELKDWSAGVVDFPSTLDGREILPLLAARRGTRGLLARTGPGPSPAAVRIAIDGPAREPVISQ